MWVGLRHGCLALAGALVVACATHPAGAVSWPRSDSAGAAKLAVDVRARLLRGPSGVIAVLIRTCGPLDAAQRLALRDAGAEISAESGDVVAARVRSDGLSHIVALGFVRYVELARELRPTPGATP